MICFWDFFALIFLQLPKLFPAQFWKKCQPADYYFPTSVSLSLLETFLLPRAHLVWRAQIKYDVQIIHLNLVCIWISLTKHCNSVEGKLLETWRRPTSGPMFSLFQTSKERKAYFREEMTSLPTERVPWETCGSWVGRKYYLSSWSKEH